MKRHFSILISFVAIIIAFSSCVKDTDFSQSDDILITPALELDLVFFTVSANRFYDNETNLPVLTISDTTNLDFLDDADLGGTIQRVEFLYQFTNSIPRTFQIDIEYLNGQNEIMYNTQANVAAGSTTSPVITTHVDALDSAEIMQLTQANKVVFVITIPSSNASLEGELNVQSKASYFLEI